MASPKEPLSFRVLKLLEAGEFRSVKSAALLLQCSTAEVAEALRMCQKRGCVVRRRGELMRLAKPKLRGGEPLSYRVLQLLEANQFGSVSKAAKRLQCSVAEVVEALQLCRIAGCVVRRRGKWLSL
ncbi:hypothetical protein [Synechococcus sp. PCC 6312]|uniref:hypothetical protein n=1 Tax=Synechococcus sp. (strain ATCC 27167 / PCC 6312) TaxID=195253 RepID=UPI00059EA8FD|nr:hypothetical protein [Synechococcus sp. PCC 6312]